MASDKFEFHDIFIPADVAQFIVNKQITQTGMMLLIVVSSLTSCSQKKCWVTNKYLADSIGVHPNYISATISDLEKLGVLIVRYRDGKRYMRPAWKWLGVKKNRNLTNEQVKENLKGGKEKPEGGVKKNLNDNGCQNGHLDEEITAPNHHAECAEVETLSRNKKKKEGVPLSLRNGFLSGEHPQTNGNGKSPEKKEMPAKFLRWGDQALEILRSKNPCPPITSGTRHSRAEHIRDLWRKFGKDDTRLIQFLDDYKENINQTLLGLPTIGSVKQLVDRADWIDSKLAKVREAELRERLGVE